MSTLDFFSSNRKMIYYPGQVEYIDYINSYFIQKPQQLNVNGNIVLYDNDVFIASVEVDTYYPGYRWFKYVRDLKDV